MKYIPYSEEGIVKNIDYSKRVIFRPRDLGNKGLQFQTATIPPKTKQRPHRHYKQTEVFYVLSGTCTALLNDQTVLAKPGDAFIVSPGDIHSFWNQTDKPFELAVFKYDFDETREDIEWMNQ